MRLSNTAAFLCLVGLVCGCGQGHKITRTNSFVAAESSSASPVGFSCDDIVWATDEVLLVTSSNRMIQAFDTVSGTEMWRKNFTEDVCAITCNESHVYVALDDSFLAGNKPDRIRRIGSKTGEDSTPPNIPQPRLPSAMAWIEELDSLCILAHEGIWMYSSDLQSLRTKIHYDGRPFFSTSGVFALCSERNDSCTLADLSTGTSSTVYGSPHVGGNNRIAMDAPFLSNAFADGSGKLIRVVDNSWSTGSVSFHKDSTSEPVTVDSENGHAIAAVHWPTQQLAVSGTEENLILFDTSGQRLAKIKSAVSERTYALAFSPSGTKVATLGSDGSIKVFTINP